MVSHGKQGCSVGAGIECVQGFGGRRGGTGGRGGRWGGGGTSSTSAEPQREETERLPCLATRPPAAAATTQEPVLMLTLPMLSPPVPTMSSTAPPPHRSLRPSRATDALGSLYTASQHDLVSIGISFPTQM